MKIFEGFLNNLEEIVFLAKTRENLPDTSLNLLKNSKIMHFRNFLKKNFREFRHLSKLPKIVFFVQMRKRFRHGLLNLLKNVLK